MYESMSNVKDHVECKLAHDEFHWVFECEILCLLRWGGGGWRRWILL